MRYVLRIAVPDRPGALGALATSLGTASVDIAALTVIERSDGVAVDDVAVESPLSAAALRWIFEEVPGVLVEALDEVRAPSAAEGPSALAAVVAEAADPLACLVEGLPDTLSARWAVALEEGSGGMAAVAATAGAPWSPPGLRLPFLPNDSARRLPPAAWMPSAWTVAGRLEVAAIRTCGPSLLFLAARVDGPRFRQGELDRLRDLTRVAVASASRRTPAVALP